MHTGFAGTEKDFFQNSDLNDGNNYNPAGLPSSANDVLLMTSATALNLNGASLSMGSLNQTNNAAYTISNNASDSTSSVIALGGGTNTVGGNPRDLIDLGGATSSLTLQGANGGTGSGTLNIGLNASGDFDVAQLNATLNISAIVNTGVSQTVTKTGAGTLNVSNLFGGNGGSIGVNAGTMNFLPGASMSNDGLFVNNPNTGPASAVVLNLETPILARGLTGSVASASSGINTATVNVMEAGMQLTLNAQSSTTSQYGGDITGNGSVAITAPTTGSAQIFSGHNTYTGTTTVSGGTLRIDGTTSGQGSYTVLGSFTVPATLSGSGTIGLVTNGTITVGGGNSASSFMMPGPNSGIGTLQVITSGTGKVTFSDNSTFLVNIGAAGASGLLAITGGKIDLTSSTDNLSLNSLSGAFDGSNYTIATFASTSNYGVFNTVTGLPSNYNVVYNPTDIMLVPVPEPTVQTLFWLGVAFPLARFFGKAEAVNQNPIT
jgi:fibronectin-binding autotransporter adhesin